jgi:glycosyltransferase involved in cell wall biosynthesis
MSGVPKKEYDQMNPSLVSIIIPVFNRANLIPETLDSVLKQTYSNWECILVDDGSSENTIEVIEQYVKKDKRFKLFIRPDSYLPGGNGARNYGFDVSNGDFIQWFDSDDIMKENFLSAKLEAIRNYPEHQSVISRNTFFQGDKILGEKFNFNRKYPEFYENTITVQIPLWTPSIMFKKSFLLRTGERLDETLKRLQEYEFFARIFVLHNHPTKLLNESLCLIRIHEKTKTSAFENDMSLEMYNSYFDANQKIISLLLKENKFTKNLENFFYKKHKRDITNSRKIDYILLSDKLSSLTREYLKHNRSYIRLIKFEIGSFLHKIIPIPNLFLIYEIKNPFLKILLRNTKRAFKIVFKRGYLKNKLQDSGTFHRVK